MTDPLQAAWQSQISSARLTINAGLLQQEVRRNRQTFKSAVFWRDLREISIALVMIPVWLYLGRIVPDFWTWYLMIPALAWLPAFMIYDRHRHRQPRPSPAQPLRECIEHALAEVEHQIRLLRNVFWWYIFPFVPPMLAFIVQISSIAYPSARLMAFIFLTFSTSMALSLWLIYRLNQHAVRTSLEPRRNELQDLLANLASEREAQV